MAGTVQAYFSAGGGSASSPQPAPRSAFPRAVWMASLSAVSASFMLLSEQAHGAAVDVSQLPPAATQPVEFTRDIAPIFASHCYSCHGSKRQESGLRLDEKAGAFQGGDTYGASAIVPGKSAESVLVQAVAQVHPDLKMPKKGERLTAAEVGL